MQSKIREILIKIDRLNEDLKREYLKIAKKQGFFIEKRKIVFLEKFRARNKLFRMPAWKYVIPRKIKHLASLPFIYMMIVPTVILDIFLLAYQLSAFPLYGIPMVKRKDYIIYDRKFLDYLNIVQKFNCLYCSYVNGLYAYAMEVAARTERYWCPIKAAGRPKSYHGWYKDFADYGDPEQWNCKFNDSSAFSQEKEQAIILPDNLNYEKEDL